MAASERPVLVVLQVVHELEHEIRCQHNNKLSPLNFSFSG